MRVNLREIMDTPGGCLPFRCALDTEGLDFPGLAGYRGNPVATGRISNEAGVLRLEGELCSTLLCVCDRCGAVFERDKRTPLRATLVEEDDGGENPELFPLDGTQAELDEILLTAFVLDMDSKFLCREDCKGLCQRCGKNLNAGPCGCGKPRDPRLAVLEQLLDK